MSRSSTQLKRPHRARSMVVVALVTMTAGVLFGVSASNARLRGTDTEMNLTTLVEDRQQIVERLAGEVGTLRERSDTLLATTRPLVAAEAENIDRRGEVIGPGVIVTLNDSPPDFQLDATANVNDAVVHQQDVDAVMNALWRGGAEAMAVQDIRITSSTVVRCVGNVILVGAQSFAPPYRIAAIGDVEGMISALDTDPSVSLYREDAARYQLGWDVQALSETRIPAAGQPGPVHYATNEGEL